MIVGGSSRALPPCLAVAAVEVFDHRAARPSYDIERALVL
jgi:hypothetical protein